MNPPRLLRPPPNRVIAATEDEEDSEEAEGLLSASVLEDSASLPVDLGRGGYDVLPPNTHVKIDRTAG